MENLNNRYKFRAWDQERKQMYNPGALILTMDLNSNDQYYTPSSYEDKFIICENKTYPMPRTAMPQLISNDHPLMQFTGLYDSNGREVWEGDVCEFYVCPSVRILERCVFENGQFCLSTYSLEFVTYNYDDSFKVLGNVFENPELLNNKDLLSSETWQKPGETA